MTPIPFPPHFTAEQQEFFVPVQTSYYTAWVDIRHPLLSYHLENPRDTFAMKAARRFVYGELPLKDAYAIVNKYEMECARVFQEHQYLMNRSPSPSIGLSNRQITFIDRLDRQFRIIDRLPNLLPVATLVFYCVAIFIIYNNTRST